MTDTALWWLTLGLGLVVLVVVLVLLHTLYRAVCRIDRGVLEVWMMGKQVARNTATTWMLAETPKVAAEIKEEALRHADYLSGGGR